VLRPLGRARIVLEGAALGQLIDGVDPVRDALGEVSGTSGRHPRERTCRRCFLREASPIRPGAVLLTHRSAVAPGPIRRRAKPACSESVQATVRKLRPRRHLLAGEVGDDAI